MQEGNNGEWKSSKHWNGNTRAKDLDAGDQVFEALERRRSLRAQTSPILVRR
jgi:hypothetical protein